MHSEAVKLIQNKNREYVQKKIEQIAKTILPFIEEADIVETWDEAIIVTIYVRKWNDILTLWSNGRSRSTSLTWTDVSTYNRVGHEWLIKA
jgi:hypothetical protein